MEAVERELRHLLRRRRTHSGRHRRGSSRVRRSCAGRCRSVRHATPSHRCRCVRRGDARHRYHVEIVEGSVPVPHERRWIRNRRHPYRAWRSAGWFRGIGVPVGRQRRSDLLHAAWTGDAAYRRWRQSSVCRIRRGRLPLCDFLDVERRQIVCRDRCRYCRRGRIRRVDRYCGSCGNGGIKPFLRLQYSQCRSWQRDCRH